MGKKNSSLVSGSEATVFVDTSLGTHLAVTVADNETVSALKRKIEYEHQVCFTSMGKINVEALKVQRKKFLYHLSDSLSLRNAFSGVNKDWFLSADASAVHGERSPKFDSSTPLLLEGSERGKEIDIAYQNGSVDSGRDTLKRLEIGVKHSGNDHCLTSSHETIDRPEQIQEDHKLCSDGYRVPTTQEREEDNPRQESDAQFNVSLEKSSPAESKRQHKNKRRNKDIVHLKENDASVQGFGEEKLQPDSIPPEISLGNRRRDVSSAMSAGNKNTTEEPCRSSASTMDNRSDSVIHRTNDTYKETDVTGKRIKSRKNASLEDASQSQSAAKKKRKFERVSGLEDSLRENDVLVGDSNNETSKQTKPKIASEFSLGDKQNNANAILDVLSPESSDLLANSSTVMNKKRKKSSSSLNQVVAAGINDKKSGGEVDGVPSSLDVNNATDAGNMESKSVVAEAKLDCHPSEGVDDLVEGAGEDKELWQRMDSKSVMSEKHKLSIRDKRGGNDTNPTVTSELLDANGNLAPDSKKKRKTRKTKGSIGETEKGSAHGTSLVGPHEAVQNDHASDKAKEEESNFSRKDEKYISEKETENSDFVRKTHNVGGNEVETLEKTDSKKKKTAKKTKGSIGGVSLDEPHEAVHADHESDKAKEEESNLSQKDRTDVSEKETERPDFVRKTDNLGGNEVGTLEQTDSKKKKQAKKTKGSIGETQIKVSGNGVSLDEPHEVVHSDPASDKAKEEESNLSQKDRTDVSEKETERPDFVRKTNNLGSNEVGTSEQTDSKQKKDKKTKGSIGETQIKVSGLGFSMDEPREAVDGDHARDKAKEEESKKDRTNVSEKETERPDFIGKTDNLGGNEVGTLEPTDSRKKKKAKNAKGSIGETQIKVSGHGVSLDERREAMHSDHASDKATEEEIILSQKDRKDVSEKETERPDFVRRTGNLDGNEVGTLEQTDSKKRKKAKKTKESIGEIQIKVSGNGVSLDEPHEAVHGDHASDKAKEEESNLSQKERTTISEKETERPDFVRRTDNLGGNEVGTLEQTDSKKKKKAKKTKESIGETQIKVSGNGVSLDEPLEAVHGDHASDKAKEEESNLSQKERTDVSEKETERPDFVRKTDNLGGNEVGTLEQIHSKKKKTAKKTKGSVGETQIKVSGLGVSMDEPREGVHGDHASDKAKVEESNLSQKDGKFVSVKETHSSDFVRKTDNLGGSELGTLKQIAKPQENTESMKQNTKKKSKRELSSVLKTSQNMHAEAEEYGKDYGIQAESIPARSNSMSATKVPSHAVEHISVGTPLEVNVTGNPPENECSKEADNHMEGSGAGNMVNFDKHLVPRKLQHEVIASGEMQAKEMSGSSRADHEPNPKKKRKTLDSTGPSSDLQSSLKSNKNQGSSGKSEACNSSSIQPQLSSSFGDDVMPHPEKKVPEEVGKTGTVTSGKMNSDSKAAKKQSVSIVSGTNTPAGKKNEAFPVSNNKADQSKMGNKRQLNVNQNHFADGKASRIDHGEIVNREGKRKSPAIPSSIFKNDSSRSSEDEGGSNASEAIAQCLSDYHFSSSAYSDGESSADMNSPRTAAKSGGRSDFKSRDSGKKLSWSELVKSSSTYKKAKVIASQSQPEDDEFVPDSQPII